MKSFFFALLLCSSVVFGQTNFAPIWQGDTTNFDFDDPANFQLNAASSGTSFISTPVQFSSKTKWLFDTDLKFAPSNSNQLEIYLATDHQNVDSIQEAIYIKVGESGSNDSYDLFQKRLGKADTLLIEASDGLAGQSSNHAEFKIELRGPLLKYNIYDESILIFEDSVQISLPPTMNHFGIHCKYTSSNKTKFEFKNLFIGDEIPLPPVEPTYHFGDVLINEIMVDPSPTIGELPEEEYIELYNNSDVDINLKDFVLRVGSQQTMLTDKIIRSNGFIFLTENSFSFLPDSIQLLVNLPALTNEIGNLSLYDSNGEIIHHVSYSDDDYNDDFKKEGGWSLELPINTTICAFQNIMMASESWIGGTPGKENSVLLEKKESLNVQSSKVLNSNILELQFNLMTFINDTTFTISTELEIDSFHFDNSPTSALQIVFKNDLIKNEIHVIEIENLLLDCNNISLDTSFTFGRSDTVSFFDLSINEVLFDPIGDESDFIEIVNISNKIIDLNDLIIATLAESNSIQNVSDEVAGILFPGEYAAFSTDKNTTFNRYHLNNENRIFQIKSLPTFPNDEGKIALIRKNGFIIDLFEYDEKMHHELLDETEGFSLEKMNPDLISNESKNWHSASESSGGATPGVKNSQFVSKESSSEILSLQNGVLSPNQDGFQDLLIINLSFEKPGYKSTLQIFDLSGNHISTLLENEITATSDQLFWNGISSSSQEAEAGIYILYFEAIHPDGEVVKEKVSFTLER